MVVKKKDLNAKLKLIRPTARQLKKNSGTFRSLLWTTALRRPGRPKKPN
eukprot:CAMPEP_0113675092 /NCGR_PEP_ID=MMETSP0038_2-20120614/7805_1 /TAXON_ID=2898 /ORGANISM="Cryptomonas paramecium" /LENGTH=48 /DNA_ID=CAMNT_0000591791 /DNA_START=311 /DNA_END=457 /DNA_ORIENTATION=- /assembly_acc=CAM_ASM_000170